MLHALKAYALSRDLVAEVGFIPKQVKWSLVFSSSGDFVTVIELGETDQKRNRGQWFTMCPNLSQPAMKAHNITKSHFLVDTLDSIVPYGKEPGNAKSVARRAYFAALLRQAESAHDGLEAIASSLTNPQVQERILERLSEQNASPTDKATIRVGDEYLVELHPLQNWWREFITQFAKESRGKEMLSLLSGRPVTPCPTHTDKIKRLSDVGGAMAGDAIIGFDKESFCSYGLKQAANAALSDSEATEYAAALNHLLASDSNSKVLAQKKIKVVWWFKEKITEDDDPIPWLADPPELEAADAESRIRTFLQSLRSGERQNLANVTYYAVTLSGNSGRVMVRDWMEGQFEDLATNIAQWFEDFEIIKRDGTGLTSPPKLMAVLGATVRDLKDLPSPHVAKMWQVAIKGQRIPNWALARALMRARIDFINGEAPRHARMGLLKAYHVRNQRLDRKEITMTAYLNEDHSSTAYQCGRLLAILAAVQKRALPGVDAGVVQRYYTAASTTPALVLGRLTSTSQHHLNKLDGGLAHWFEDQIASVWSRIKDSIPTTLSLEEQSLFALGYYQQMAHLRTRKTDKNDDKANA
jgi:CRISPR-associated protein Csd1